MKKQALFTLTALALITLGAHAQHSSTQMKAHIMHHSGSQIQMYDTLFSKSDDYSIEQFLRDKGFDPAETEIIRTEGVGEQGVWLMESNGNCQLSMTTTGDDGQDHQSVFIRKYCGDKIAEDSEQQHMKVIRLGEGTDDIHIDQLSEINWREVVEGIVAETAMNVKVVKLINDDGDEEKRLWINGEEVDPESEEGQEFFKVHSGNRHKMVTIERDGNGDTEQRIHRKVIVVKNEETEVPEGTTIDTLESDDNTFGNSFTNALLAEVPSFDDVPASTGETLDLRIENLKFFPNPNEGKFNLQFELPHSGATQVEIFNTSGQRVYSEDLGSFSGEFRRDIDISEQPAGTYILHITQAGKHLAEKVIVK